MSYQANSQRSMADFDQILIWTVMILFGLGLVMVYSASIVIAEDSRGAGGSSYYLIRHAAYIFVGLLLGALAFQIPMQRWQQYSSYLFLFGVFRVFRGGKFRLMGGIRPKDGRLRISISWSRDKLRTRRQIS